MKIYLFKMMILLQFLLYHRNSWFGKGYEYFHSYINTPNYLASDEQIKKTFFKAVKAIGENIAPVSKLVQFFCHLFLQ